MPPRPALNGRLATIASEWPGAILAVARESRLGGPDWDAIHDALVAVDDDAKPLATAFGMASASRTLVGGNVQIPGDRIVARVVSKRRISAQLFQAMATAGTPVDAHYVRGWVDEALRSGDASAFRAEFGDAAMSRYFLWATFSTEGGNIAETLTREDDVEARLGLKPVSDPVILFYELPPHTAASIPTVCDANAGWTNEMNECFQPSSGGAEHGITVRCSDHDAQDGFPEIVHPSVPMRQLRGLRRLSAVT